MSAFTASAYDDWKTDSQPYDELSERSIMQAEMTLPELCRELEQLYDAAIPEEYYNPMLRKHREHEHTRRALIHNACTLLLPLIEELESAILDENGYPIDLKDARHKNLARAHELLSRSIA